MMELKCIVVDDDEVSRNILKRYVEKSNLLSLSFLCKDGIEAFEIIGENDVDVVFLDVEMPDMTGIELAKNLKSIPKQPLVVLVTSRENYAVKAFEYDVIDYLVKPVSYSRFLQSIQKIKNALESQNINETYQDNKKSDEIFVKSDRKIIKVKLNEIIYIEAMSDYVIIKTQNNKFITHSSMKKMIDKLDQNSFIRIHRSYIINKRHIQSIQDTSVKINNDIIPIGNSYKNTFLDQLNIL